MRFRFGIATSPGTLADSPYLKSRAATRPWRAAEKRLNGMMSKTTKVSAASAATGWRMLAGFMGRPPPRRLSSSGARHPPEAPLPQLEHSLDDQRQRRRGDRPREERRGVVEREARCDALAVAARADEGGDGRCADVDHRRG